MMSRRIFRRTRWTMWTRIHMRWLKRMGRLRVYGAARGSGKRRSRVGRGLNRGRSRRRSRWRRRRSRSGELYDQE